VSKDVAKTKQLLVGASGTDDGIVQLRSSQKKQQGIFIALEVQYGLMNLNLSK